MKRDLERENAALRELANDLTKILLREGDVQGAIQRQAFRMMTEMTVNNRQLFDELGFKGDHDDKVNKALLELKALREAAEAALSEHEARLGRCVCGICTPLKAAMGRNDEH